MVDGTDRGTSASHLAASTLEARVGGALSQLLLTGTHLTTRRSRMLRASNYRLRYAITGVKVYELGCGYDTYTDRKVLAFIIANGGTENMPRFQLAGWRFSEICWRCWS